MARATVSRIRQVKTDSRCAQVFGAYSPPTNRCACQVYSFAVSPADELVSKSKDIENGKMLYEIIDFHLPSLGAIGIEFSRLPAMFGLMKKFDRAAVLTDKTWLKKVSEFDGVLYPGLEIKTFNRDQKVEAEAWLSS